ncbi:NTE family protein [Marinobacter daqiaonensis]|uniref:NTE family protein n=1 Tax=Marinobacter daqiaonensis TaxID=650891 RepID=A0A1I6GYY6_9GAMM|nr:patatin-like phospholipase family protein [Marinobacter daqiaonensis]SFR47424.1 NTE family protein [Marinobacter daqiaonensis]
MDIELITKNEKLAEIVRITREDCENKSFSDVVDASGHQYIDLVMEGGGMLGIALVGYVYVLEQIGIRFLGIAGTSAGSITALLLAALGTPDQAKGEKLLQLMAEKDFKEFVDGDSDARDFVESWLDGAGKIKLAFKAAQVIDNFQEDMGLNPGLNFLEWIRTILRNENISTSRDLQQRMRTLPQGIGVREGIEPFATSDELFARLAIIAADVATETKVEFPRMAPLYWEDPENVDPALFVRASMSIPFFFHPMEVKPLPRDSNCVTMWKEFAGLICREEEDYFPNRGLFIDGGIISNFPINVFHDSTRVPRLPTFGVKLQLDERLQKISGPVDLALAIFNSARHALDYDFITNNPDYRKLVQWIPAKGFNWLNFSMTDEEKVNLFLEGAFSAQKFLREFDWQNYKRIRRELLSGLQ